MKNLKQSVILVLLVLSTPLFINCNNTDEEAIAPAENLDAVLFEIAELGKAEKKIVTFKIVFNKQTNSYTCDTVKIIKDSKEAIDFAKGADPDFKYAGDSYEVEYTDAEGHKETKTCENYACIGYVVAACVENGGSAKVCKVDATYYPPAL